MINQENYTSFRMEVTVSVYAPHNQVDTETLQEAAKAAILQHFECVPRLYDGKPGEGPVFQVSAESLECEIEDDWREGDEHPEEFDASLAWWIECCRKAGKTP